MLQRSGKLSVCHRPRPSAIVRHGRPRVRCSAVASPVDAYKRLEGLQVLRATDGQPVELVKLWGPGQRVLVTWTRSLGCPFCQEMALQLARDVKPKLDTMGTQLFMVTIGTPERSKDFCARTGFPADRLLLDPENVTYDALGLKRNIPDTFFNIATPMSLVNRFTSGNSKDFMNILNGWEPWQPPKGPVQALQQGGTFVFEGENLLWSYMDEATGAHAQLPEVMSVVESLAANAKDCGCETAPVRA